MHLRPCPSGTGVLDDDDSRIALVIWLAVRFSQGILFLPARMTALSWTVGGRGKRVT